MSCESISLSDYRPKTAIPMLKELQKGTIVEGYCFGWKSGKLHSVGRHASSDVVYIQHDEGAPTMYFYDRVRIPGMRTLFGE